MPLLLTNEILTSIINEIKNAEKSVLIITAYCKKNVVEQLNNYISKSITSKRIMLRFRLDDIVNGSTDFSVAEYCLCNGWEVYVRFDLHAKTYIVDNKRGIVGSANVSKSGLALSQHSNVEMGTLVNIDDGDLVKINFLFDGAIKLNKKLIEEMKAQLSMITGKKKLSKHHTWNRNITDLFSPRIETLFSYQLPNICCPKIGEYVDFLEETYDGNRENLKEKFRWCPAYLWLLNTLKSNNKCLYFGALSEKLHNILVSDPPPYRKDVKILLNNLLSFIIFLKMEEIIIDKPSYSQRIQIVN